MLSWIVHRFIIVAIEVSWIQLKWNGISIKFVKAMVKWALKLTIHGIILEICQFICRSTLLTIYAVSLTNTKIYLFLYEHCFRDGFLSDSTRKIHNNFDIYQLICISTLVHIIACCLVAPSHQLYQCGTDKWIMANEWLQSLLSFLVILFT